MFLFVVTVRKRANVGLIIVCGVSNNLTYGICTRMKNISERKTMNVYIRCLIWGGFSKEINPCGLQRTRAEHKMKEDKGINSNKSIKVFLYQSYILATLRRFFSPVSLQTSRYVTVICKENAAGNTERFFCRNGSIFQITFFQPMLLVRPISCTSTLIIQAFILRTSHYFLVDCCLEHFLQRILSSNFAKNNICPSFHSRL